MKTLSARLTLILFASIFSFLFYHQGLGINLVVLELVLAFYWIYRKLIQTGLQKILIGALVINVFMSLVNHAIWTYMINFILLAIVIGTLAAPELKHLYYIFLNAMQSILKSQFTWIKELFNTKRNGKKATKSFKILRYILIPSFIIILFVIIYSASNPKFGYYFSWFFSKLTNAISDLLEMIDFDFLLLFILGLVLSATFIFQFKDEYSVLREKNSSDFLTRIKMKGKSGSFLNEYKGAIFLFTGLNLILLFLNCMDIYWVWFNFKWEGQFLKEFVHQGTYMLILSILISIGLVFYYFRGNINFFSKNKSLKTLAYVWLAQNSILVISVFIRNWYYISFYALAYKRIAIIFFLVFIVILLTVVYLKVAKLKSNYFITRIMGYSLVSLLLLSSIPNWDVLIARYNFSKKDKSFIHLNYLATLSDSALPYLNVPLDELEKLDLKQAEKFENFEFDSFSSSNSSFYRRNYMEPEEYYRTIQNRIQQFKQEWKSKGILSWNYAEYQAYFKLMKNDERIKI